MNRRNRKSSIVKLDPRIKEAVDAAIRGEATIDEIVAKIHELGGQASRSAVGRYVKNAEEELARHREFMQVADRLVGKMHEEPGGDIGRLGTEVIRMAVYQAAREMGKDGKPIKAMDAMLLAKALEHGARADKTGLDRFLKRHAELGAKLEKLEGKAAKGGKITAEDLRAIRQDVYGIAG